MNKAEKQAVAASLRNEATVLRQTRENYKEARANIEEKLKVLAEREQTKSVIWQRQYQEALKAQLDTAIDALSSKNYSNISQYLNGEYENGFIGTMYSLQKQGIPLAMPINQRRVVKMVETGGDGIKLSKRLYGNATKLKNAVRREVSIGLASGESYQSIAGRLTRTMGVDYNKTVRIARTEGGRVQNGSRFDAMTEAKKNGADIVKQWDSTLDNRTRTAHRELEGQIRELEEPFEAEGQQAQHPHGFGVAWMDVNCRCIVVQRARWAVEDPEFDDMTKFSRFGDDFDRDEWVKGNLAEATKKHDGRIVDLSDSDNFDDFKRRYKDASNNIAAQNAAKKAGVEVMGEAVEAVAPEIFASERLALDEAGTYKVPKRKAGRLTREERHAYHDAINDIAEKQAANPRVIKSADEFESYLKRNGIKVAGASDVDPLLFDDIAKAVNSIKRSFPELVKETSISFDKMSALNGMQYDTERKILQINAGKASDYRDFLKSQLDQIGRGFFVGGNGTFQQTVLHEYGHGLEERFRSKAFKRFGTERFDELVEALNEIEKEPLAIMRKHRPGKTAEDVYGLTNFEEAFAEGFSELITNPKSALAKDFKRYLRRMIAKWGA